MTFSHSFFPDGSFFLKRATSLLFAIHLCLSTLLLTVLLPPACCYGTDVPSTSSSPYYLQRISKEQMPKLGEMKVERPQNGVTKHIANYPADVSRFDRSSVGTSSNARQGNSSDAKKILDETPPFPQGKVSDSRLMTSLQQIKTMSDLALAGKPVTLSPVAETQTAQSPKEEKPAVTNPDATLYATQFLQNPDTKKWFAKLTDQRIVPVEQVGTDVFYLIDSVSGALKNQVLRAQDNNVASQTPASKNNENKKAIEPDAHTAQQAVLLILAIGSVFAALYVGFLAIDYKHRWEQEMAGMNQRFLSGDSRGASSDLSLTGPDTLRFSDSLETTLLDHSADSLSDRPYRTIA